MSEWQRCVVIDLFDSVVVVLFGRVHQTRQFPLVLNKINDDGEQAKSITEFDDIIHHNALETTAIHQAVYTNCNRIEFNIKHIIYQYYTIIKHIILFSPS